MSNSILTVKNLTVKSGDLFLLDGVSFELNMGETLGIVGESGCGKSMTALSIMGLLPKGVSVSSGAIFFKEKNLLSLKAGELQKIRGRKIALIFQNPQAALNPIRTIRDQIDDAIRAHFQENRQQREERMVRFLTQVELPEPEKIAASYPFQLSGGMLQRVLIAMALCLEPEILIADEPTTAIDAVIQMQIIQLLNKIQKQTGMAMLIISHNFGVVAKLAQQVLVMYGGRIAEHASTSKILNQPLHPYTKALLNSRPSLNRRKKLATIPGNPPPAGALHECCKFLPRCPEKIAMCSLKPPQPVLMDESKVACFLYGEVKNAE